MWLVHVPNFGPARSNEDLVVPVREDVIIQNLLIVTVLWIEILLHTLPSSIVALDGAPC